MRHPALWTSHSGTWQRPSRNPPLGRRRNGSARTALSGRYSTGGWGTWLWRFAMMPCSADGWRSSAGGVTSVTPRRSAACTTRWTFSRSWSIRASHAFMTVVWTPTANPTSRWNTSKGYRLPSMPIIIDCLFVPAFGSWARYARPSAMPISTAWCIATSSRPTSLSTEKVSPSYSTSALPSGWIPRTTILRAAKRITIVL